MSDTEADYHDDLGEMDGIGERPLPDFLPPPDRLIRREHKDETVVAAGRVRVDILRRQAGTLRGPRYRAPPTRG